MKIDVSEQIEQLNAIIRLWQDEILTKPDIYILNDLKISSENLSSYFIKLASLLQSIHEQETDELAWITKQSEITNSIKPIKERIEQFIDNKNISTLNGIYNNLSLAINTSTVFIDPLKIMAKSNEDIEHELDVKWQVISDTEKKAIDFQIQVSNIELQAKHALKFIEDLKGPSEERSKEVQEILENSKKLEPEIIALKEKSETTQNSLNTMIALAQENIESLKKAIIQKDKLFVELDEIRDKIEGYLEGANKVGLAKSFQDKKKKTATALKLYSGAFSLGILFLIGFGGFWTYRFSTSVITLNETLLHLLIVSPVIWFTWFFARQYGFNKRVLEDYAYKEAIAMAFVGYRNEVHEDPDMLKLLQESTLKNFVANPVRLLLKRADPSSPIHGLIEQLMELEKNPKLVNTIISLISSIKGQKDAK